MKLFDRLLDDLADRIADRLLESTEPNLPVNFGVAGDQYMLKDDRYTPFERSIMEQRAKGQYGA